MTREEVKTAKEMLHWNLVNPDKKQFTKAEYSNSEGFDTSSIISWNTLLSDAEQYTDEECLYLIASQLEQLAKETIKPTPKSVKCLMGKLSDAIREDNNN